MKKYKLISSCVSLVLTLALLVVTIFAWYVTNESATADGIVASTSSSIYEYDVKRYIAVESSGSYTIGSELSSTNNPAPYSILGYDKVIYDITFKTKGNRVGISMTTSGTRSNVFRTGTDYYANYLSNVASFYELEKNGNSYTAVTANQYSLPYYQYGETNVRTNMFNVECSSDTLTHIYLLFDFNQTNMALLFSDNLGYSDFDKVLFDNDIKLYLTA